MSTTLGLRQSLLKAKSETEVTDLLNRGKTFEFASQSTRNAWKKAARRALNGLGKVEVEQPEVVEEETAVTKKKRGNKKKPV